MSAEIELERLWKDYEKLQKWAAKRQDRVLKARIRIRELEREIAAMRQTQSNNFEMPRRFRITTKKAER